jgi:hypothetical protein
MLRTLLGACLAAGLLVPVLNAMMVDHEPSRWLGAAALANTEPGVKVWGASTTLIGGDTALKRNIISGNTQQGIVIGGSATGTMVSGNWIGVGADGTTAFGNAAQAIYVAASDVLIGGTSAAQANIIANVIKEIIEDANSVSDTVKSLSI